MRLGVDEPEEVVLLVRRRNAPNGYENVAVAPKGFDLAGHVAAHPFDRLALIGRAVDVRDHRSGDDNMQREGLGPGRQLEVRDDALADEPFEGAGQGRIAHGGTTPNREHAFARLGPLEVPVPSPALHGSEPPHSLSSSSSVSNGSVMTRPVVPTLPHCRVTAKLPNRSRFSVSRTVVESYTNLTASSIIACTGSRRGTVTGRGAPCDTLQ